jgi:predicted 2-oxoglutarate/Fe(II)-dependent dioxygenase YbiX
MENTTFTNPDASSSSMKLASLEILSLNKAPLFTKEECQTIIDNCLEDLWLESRVVGDDTLHKSKRQKLRGEPEGFPFDPIRIITKQANEEIYDFRLLGIIDQDFPQIHRYSEGDYYDLHLELSPMATTRKLTFIVNLSDSESYEGGNIEFLNTDTSEADLNEQGSILIFPSFLPYKITEVTKGNKDIIIGNIHGAVFR